MNYGTHNSATGGRLVWWLRPFSWLINLTSKCQSNTILDQLSDGVRLFNLQVALVGGKWRFTHGLAVYKEDVLKTLSVINSLASHTPVYVTLCLDRCFWCKKDVEAFEFLVERIRRKYGLLTILYAWVEGTDQYVYTGKKVIRWEEHYWTLAWGKKYGETWLDRLPLPRRHARKYNEKYKKECVVDYLMLDFYNHE